MRSRFRQTAIGCFITLLTATAGLSHAQTGTTTGGNTTTNEVIPNAGATPPTDASAASGQTFGNTLYPNAGNLATFNQDTGTFTFPGAGDATINVNQLFPGSAGGDQAQYTNLYNDNAGIQQATQQAQQKAATDTSAHGKAWSIPATANSRTHPDLTNDPMWAQTDFVNKNQDAIAQQFSDCKPSTTVVPTTTTSHIPDYKSCQRVSSFTGTDTLTHRYAVQPAINVTGIEGTTGTCLLQADGSQDCTRFNGGTGTPFNIGDAPTASCGQNCLQLILGHTGDNFLSGSKSQPCTLYKYQVTVQVPVAGAVSNVTLTTAHWDDRMLVLLDDTMIYNPSGGMQVTPNDACDLVRSNVTAPNVDVTAAFTQSTTMVFTMYIQVGGNGEGWAILNVTYNKNLLVQDYGWAPQAAIDLANLAAQCPTGSITPTVSPPLDNNGCSQFNNDMYCPSDFPPAPVAGINPLVEQATVNVSNCAGNLGTAPCRTLADGSQYCPVNTPGNTTTNNCGTLQNNPSCSYENTVCMQYDESNTCVAFEDTYDCGENVQVNNAATQTVMNCQGPIKCIGESCATKGTETQNPAAFSQAVGALSTAQAISTNTDCDAKGNCTIFQSKEGACHSTVGGIVNDCCNGKTGASLKTFMDLSLSMVGDEDAANRLSYEDPTYGAWHQMMGGGIFGQGLETQPITSQADNTAGSTSQNTTNDAAADSNNASNGLTDKQRAQVSAALGEAAASTMFQQKKQQPAHYEYSPLLNAPFGLANGLMAAYMTWEITLALLNYLAPCTKDEFQTVSKVHLKACHRIGPHCVVNILGACMENEEIYCCYATPLARIVSEQLYPQLGISYGTPTHPNCPAGIAISDLAKVNLNQVNFNEYAGILTETGHMPDPNNAGNLTVQALTGKGSTLDYNGKRQDATSRANQRIYDMNPEANRQTSDQALWGNNPLPTKPVTGAAPPPN